MSAGEGDGYCEIDCTRNSTRNCTQNSAANSTDKYLQSIPNGLAADDRFPWRI